MNSELQRLLNAANAHPFLFIGSGFSRRYLESEDWKGLVAHFATKAKPESSMAFASYRYEVGDPGKSDVELLPSITERVERDFNRVFLENDEYAEIREANSEAIDRGCSPFKICVAEYLKDKEDQFDNPLHPDEISALGHSRKNTAGIVTTNFDRFLERLFPEHVPYIGQDELLFNLSYGVGELFKIHGCVSQPETMVLTKTDYDRFGSRNVYLAAKLLTVFLEHPIFFIGYSLNDGNIRRIFSDIANCLNEEQLGKLTDRLFFVQRINSNRQAGIHIVRDSFDGKTIQFKQVVTDDFSAVFKAISAMRSSYSPKVLRKLKKDIYKLVHTTNPKESIRVVDMDDQTSAEEVEVVIGVGINQRLADVGLQGIEAIDLVEDVILEDRNWTPQPIVEVVLPKLGKRWSYNFPIFKYLSRVNEEGLDPRLLRQVEQIRGEGIDFWITNSMRTAHDRHPSNAATVTELITDLDIKNVKDASCALVELAFVPIDRLMGEMDTFRKFLKELYQVHDQILKINRSGLASNFRRAVKIYDYLEYEKKHR